MLALEHEEILVEKGLNCVVGRVVGQLPLRVERGVDQVVEGDAHEALVLLGRLYLWILIPLLDEKRFHSVGSTVRRPHDEFEFPEKQHLHSKG